MEKRRILIVDDEVSIARTLKMYLEENGGYDVRVENAGSRALATARDFRPHLIFLDIVMPDADGGVVAGQIKADSELGGTPVIFLTALVSQAEAGGEDRSIGGHPFLAKPVDPEVVIAYIEKYASR